MKKSALILCLIAALLCFTACRKADNAQNTQNSTAEKAEVPVASENPQNETSEAEVEEAEPEDEKSDKSTAESENKLEPAVYYGGAVKSIEGNSLVIITDDNNEEIGFTLSEKAKKDIEHFSVEEGTEVVVDYELSGDGNTKTATNVNIIKNAGKTE